MAEKILVSCQKGGVGKTTTIHNLAVCLAKMNYEVLVIDLDPTASLTEALGFERGDFEDDNSNLLFSKNSDVRKCIWNTNTEHLSLIPSDTSLSNMRLSIHVSNIEDKGFILKEAIAPIEDAFDFILFDTSPTMDILVVNAHFASDWLIIPTEASKRARVGLTDSLSFFNTCVKKHHIDIELIGVLITRFTEVNQRQKECRQSFSSEFSVCGTIRASVQADRGADLGLCAVETDPNGDVSRAYQKLAKKIIKEVERRRK
ncbi:MAG: ParA family protein [Eubacteriaceae bacterium]